MKNEYYLEFNKLKESGQFNAKYFLKFERDVEEIVKPLVNDWVNSSEKEIEGLSKKFGNVARDEYSKLHSYIFSDKDIAEALLKIANNNVSNHKILIEIVSSINQMHARYNLIITNDIFNFLINQTKNKKVAFYISIFITNLVQFKKYQNRWEYILSIPKISPKNKSINTFYRVINDNLEEILEKDKSEVVSIFKDHIKNNPGLHSTTIAKFTALIDRLCVKYD